jgi:hypothetical protein
MNTIYFGTAGEVRGLGGKSNRDGEWAFGRKMFEAEMSD